MSVGRAEIAVQMLRKVRAQSFRRQFWHRNQGIPSTPWQAIVTASAPICNIDCAAPAVCRQPDSPLVLENPEMLAQINTVVLDGGGCRDNGNAAAIEDDDVIGDVENQLRILLHQHDGKSAFLEF